MRKLRKTLLVLAWFLCLSVFNAVRPHRVNIASQLIAPQAFLTDSEGAEHPILYRFLQGLGETTGGVQLMLSAVVLFGIVFLGRKPLADRE